MPYEKHELLIIREHLGSSKIFGGAHVDHLSSFLCCVLVVFVLCLVCPMLPACLKFDFSNVYFHAVIDNFLKHFSKDKMHSYSLGGRCGHNRMVFGFTTTYAISAYHH